MKDIDEIEVMECLGMWPNVDIVARAEIGWTLGYRISSIIACMSTLNVGGKSGSMIWLCHDLKRLQTMDKIIECACGGRQLPCPGIVSKIIALQRSTVIPLIRQ